MSISANIHIKSGSKAFVQDNGSFCSVHVEPNPSHYSHIAILLPEYTTREQADAIADAINTAVAVVAAEAEQVAA